MGQIGQKTAVSAGATLNPTRAGSFAGHLRVREAAAEERRGLERFFPDRDRSQWASRTLQSGRVRALVVEIVKDGKWVPLGHAVVDAVGEMVFCILPPYRGRGHSAAAIRSVLQHLREYPLTVLTARIGDAEPAASRAFERAGFVFAGQSVSAGRTERLYEFIIRDECTAFNVWI
ncbi:MAG TPA: GNAT family N-acetyltransferase [Syntrophales bacterium]|nr:GNAT family N-acetyltransferase [Syntrophales bacterium]